MSNANLLQGFQWGVEMGRSIRESRDKKAATTKLYTLMAEQEGTLAKLPGLAPRAKARGVGEAAPAPALPGVEPSTSMPLVEAAVGATPALPVPAESAAPAPTPALPVAEVSPTIAATPALPVAGAAESAAPAPTPALPVASAVGAAEAAPAPVTDAGASAGPQAGAIFDTPEAETEFERPAVSFAQFGGMLAEAELPPEQALEVIKKYHAVGNQTLAHYLGQALNGFGSPQAGRSLALSLGMNDPDADYRFQFNKETGQYVVYDMNSDTPEEEAFVIDRNWIEGALAQASDNKAPILEHNKGVVEMGQRAAMAQAALSNAGTAQQRESRAGVESERAADSDRFGRVLSAAEFRLEAEKFKADNALALAKFGLDVKEFDLKAGDVTQAKKAGEGTGLDQDDTLALLLIYKQVPQFSESGMLPNTFMAAVSDIMGETGGNVFQATQQLMALKPSGQ